MNDYFFSSRPEFLDTDFIVRSLQSTYWANDRTREVILQCLSSSLCFGAYLAGSRQQVAFARVITDQTTFSWLCDVFVDPTHRRRGIARKLLAEILADPRVSKTRVYLATRDAHSLYEPFGFARQEVMRRPSPDPHPQSQN